MNAQPLFNHQLESIRFFQDKERGFDASDPGTGKTRVQIELFALRRRRGGGCGLVVAPKSLLRSAWGADFAKFAPDMRVVIADAKNRETAFASDADIFITNTDATRWLAKQPIKFFGRFDTLIIDESPYFKHRTSQRAKALNKIKKHFKYRFALTGTPNSNDITDIWNQVNLLDDGRRLGASFWNFRSAVCTPRRVGPHPNMVRWEAKPGAEQTVATLLKDIVIRHEFDKCVDIPECFMYSVDYQMSDAVYERYREMEEHAITVVKNDTVSAINAAVLVSKLLQIASGAVYGDGTSYSLVDTGRHELIADLVEQRKNCLVFFNWRHQRDELIKELTKRGLTYVVLDGDTSLRHRDEAVKSFQKGFYRVMLAHPASAAHGLTLTQATTTIWSSPTYNLEHFLQGNRRIYRAGQTQKTEIITVVAEHTIETKVLEKLQTKNVKQSDLLQVLTEKS